MDGLKLWENEPQSIPAQCKTSIYSLTYELITCFKHPYVWSHFNILMRSYLFMHMLHSYLLGYFLDEIEFPTCDSHHSHYKGFMWSYALVLQCSSQCQLCDAEGKECSSMPSPLSKYSGRFPLLAFACSRIYSHVHRCCRDSLLCCIQWFRDFYRK